MIDLFNLNTGDRLFKINTLDFNKAAIEQVDDHGKNWPVVYVIHNSSEKSKKEKSKIYIGETSNFSNRFKEHLPKKKKEGFKKISYLYDGFENKSVILDYEASLIRLCCAEPNLDVINRNCGQSQSHDYYARNDYRSRLKALWNTLKEKKIVSSDYEKVVNANLFKYSPYTDLTPQQHEYVVKILNTILKKNVKKKDKGRIAVVQGGAGTGKTLLAVKMIYTLSKYKEILEGYKYKNISSEEEMKNKFDERIVKICEMLKTKKRNLKIGFIVPQQSLREDLEKVFKNIDKMPQNVIFSPGGDDFGSWEENHFDILFVDEAHRLKHGRKLIHDTQGNIKYSYNCIRQSQCKNFKDACERLWPDLKNLKEPEKNEKIFEKNQLDVLLKCSKHVVLFYDANQRVTTNDVTDDELEISINNSQKERDDFTLETQLRCSGGNNYIEFINAIFDGKVEKQFESNSYELKIFDDVGQMRCQIIDKNNEIGLCRMAAGYAWPWRLKQKANEIKRKKALRQAPTVKRVHQRFPKLYDFQIDKNTFIWNTEEKGWVASKNSINEIGCIHTIQGYDLNYIGLIIGSDLSYDDIQKKIIACPDKNCDTFKNDGEIIDASYIINTYKTMLFRGVLGCYIYVCDKNLRNYLKKYIKTYGEEYTNFVGNNTKVKLAAENKVKYDASEM